MKKVWDKWTRIALVKRILVWSDPGCGSGNCCTAGNRNRNSG